MKHNIKDIPIILFNGLEQKNFLSWIPDKIYLKILYRLRMGYFPDLKNPKTFNEKLQWLKLNDRKDHYSLLVDKVEAKNIVADRLGDEYIIKTLGIWDDAEDINFELLPQRFVLKCTHDSGSIILCEDKDKFNYELAIAQLNESLKTNYYKHTREWPYKNVQPRIIAEEFIEDGLNKELRDYKFFCFNGKPKFLYLSEGSHNHKTTKISFFDLNGNKMQFRRSDYPELDTTPKFPSSINKMIDLSSQLAELSKSPFIRVDFYSINNRILFSEFTFYPCSGMLPFEPEKWDRVIGDLITLP